MPYLESIGLENFRIFNNETTIRFAPLTILTGPNNSGKSTIIKALLLLKENIERKNFPELLDFKGQQHELISFENTANIVKGPKDHIVFKLRLNLFIDGGGPNMSEEDSFMLHEQAFLLELRYAVSISDINSNNNVLNVPYLDELIIYDFKGNELITSKHLYNSDGSIENADVISGEKVNSFSIHVNTDQVLKNLYYYKQANRNSQNINNENYGGDLCFSDNYVFNIGLLKLNFNEGEIVTEFLQLLNNKIIRYNEKVEFKRNNVQTINIWNHANDRLRAIQSDRFKNIISEIDNDRRFSGLGQIYYEDNNIGPLKIIDLFAQEERSKFADILLSVGEVKIAEIIKPHYLRIMKNVYSAFSGWLGFTSTVLSRIRRINAFKGIPSRLFLHKDPEFLSSALNSLQHDKNFKRKSFVNYWLGEKGFNICDDIEIVVQKYGTEVNLIKNGKSFNLLDMGYGTSQLIALILHISFADKHELVFLEEPETNLHPDFQSKLSAMVVDAYKKFKIDFIIETHSEYLIRMLQYLTAINKLTTEETIIYYFNKSDNAGSNGFSINELSIDNDGSLSDDFGPGFIDEALKLKLDLLMRKNQDPQKSND